MAILFPTAIDTLTNPGVGNPLNAPSHAGEHSDENDAIEALEAKVGIDGSAVTTSHDYKLSGVTGADKAVSLTGTEALTNKTLTTPIVSGAGGTTAGMLGFDNADDILKVGDGTTNEGIFVGAWKSFTPSYTNLTIGNGTNVGAYAQVGKTVFFRVAFTFGTTSSIAGTPALTFPVTISPLITNFPNTASGRAVVGGNAFPLFMGTGGSINMLTLGVVIGISGITPAFPGAWTTGDTWGLLGYYQAA